MAANQARRRNDLDSVPTINKGSQHPKVFTYQPLDPDPDADSIRLVLIEPSSSRDDPLSCKLIHVKFAEKRRYEALSYMWGDEAVKEKILLDGAEFWVGQNLGDALHFLRSSLHQGPFWIDAICINQHDVRERNSQLAMMKWIYFRAETVVIWLGKKYSRYQLLNQIPFDQELVTELRADGYWDRLWIIQEIGRAHQKEVCFGDIAMDWYAFIDMIMSHNGGCDGPLRLHRLVQDKYSGSHTLRNLLQDHQEALCKEPRDKIYGLLGLAADAIEFPVDYGKSLLEVWTDTMEFMNGQQLLSEPEIVPFAMLIKRLLIGNNLRPLRQALQPYERWKDSAHIIKDPKSPRVFQLQGYVVGCIMAIGPSIAETISSLRKADQWAAEILRNFQRNLGEAHRENDILMRAILENNETNLASLCFSHVSNVPWDDLQGYCNSSKVLKTYASTIKEGKSKYSASSWAKSRVSSHDALPSFRCSHLFLIKNLLHNKTLSKMGIASELAQPGDLVCWIPGVERALTLRVTLREKADALLQVFGTALFSEDFDKNDKEHHDSRLKWFHEEAKFAIRMDAATIFVLLA